MDGRNGPVVSRVNLFARVPGELKYLVICFQNANRLPTFNIAMQRLLETHPALAQLAATIYTESKASPGLDTPIETGEPYRDDGSANVASLFLG